jgi:hypothetical protein
MGDSGSESSDLSSRTLAEPGRVRDVQSLPDDLMADVASELPTSAMAAGGAFLVANWLVGEGEG